MRRLILLVLLAGILILPAMAQSTTEDSYTEEFNKLKDTNSYIYRNEDTISWQIINFDLAYNYYIRIYALGHTAIIQEYPIKDASGEIRFIYPGFSPIHINLQKQIPEGKESEYCKSYPCKISENLDIISINPTSKIRSTDIYTLKLRHWTRAPFDTIHGASWQAMINVDRIDPP